MGYFGWERHYFGWVGVSRTLFWVGKGGWKITLDGRGWVEMSGVGWGRVGVGALLENAHLNLNVKRKK